MRTVVVSAFAALSGLLLACAAPVAQKPVAPASAAPAQGSEVSGAVAQAAPPLTEACVDQLSPSASAEEQLECLLVVQRWRLKLETASELFRTGMPERFPMVPAQELEWLKEALEKYGSAERLYTLFKARMSTPELAPAVSEFLTYRRSPQSRTVQTLEEVEPAVIDRWIAEHPLSPARAEALDRYVRVLRRVEMQQLLMFKLPFIAIDAARTPDEQARMRAKDQELDTQIDQKLRADARGSYAYHFRNLTDRELAAITQRVSEPRHQKALELEMEALEAAMREAVTPVGIHLRPVMVQRLLYEKHAREASGATATSSAPGQ